MVDTKQAEASWISPVVGAVIVVLSLIVPVRCNLSAGHTAYATADGGPVVGGVLAIVVAAWSLIRGRRGRLGAPGVVAVIVAALGGAQLARGVLSMERAQTAAEQVDLDAPTRQFFERMRDDQVAAIVADAEPEVQEAGAPMIDAMARGFARGLGRWQAITATDRKANGDRVAALGDARFERGVVHYEITFRLRGGVPHLVGFDLRLADDQRPPVAGADQAARALADALAAGAPDRVRERIDPRVTVPDELDDKIHQLHDALRTPPTIEQLSSAPCDEVQCVEMRLSSPTAVVNLHLQLSSSFGIWLASSFKIDSQITP